MNSPFHSRHRDQESLYLEERPDEPDFMRFWWNPPCQSVKALSAAEVTAIGRQVLQWVTGEIGEIRSFSSVKEGTWEIADRVHYALRSQGFECHREIPFTHELVDGFARVDVIAFSQGLPTLYIEIDSSPVALNLEKNARKLEAAWRMGAVPVWIGWHKFDPDSFDVDFPLARFRVLERSEGMIKEASYRRAAERSLRELGRVVDKIIAMSPKDGRCNFPTKTGTLCRREQGRCTAHDAERETLSDIYPGQFLEAAIEMAEKLKKNGKDRSGVPGEIRAPDEELLARAYLDLEGF
jgi:hypothetical protein